MKLITRLSVLVILILPLTGCHTSKKGSAGSGKSHPKVETVNVKNLKGEERKIVEEALTWQGTPYKYGASNKGKGTDCSGMVVGVFSKVTDKKLPRNSREQADYCRPVKKKSIRPGDLVFFATGKDPKRISHVGIMIDANRFIHASTKKGVIISELTTPYYERTFIKCGRVP